MLQYKQPINGTVIYLRDVQGKKHEKYKLKTETRSKQNHAVSNVLKMENPGKRYRDAKCT